MPIDERLPHRARMLLFSTLEQLREEIRPKFSDWKDADGWLFSQLDFTKDELFQIYKGRDTMVYIGSAVELPETKFKASLITGREFTHQGVVNDQPEAVFYYTFGTADQFPFKKGWVEVHAQNRKEADAFFRLRFPDCHEGTLNCSFVYSQDEFRKQEAVYNSHPHWRICHEVVTAETLRSRGLLPSAVVGPTQKFSGVLTDLNIIRKFVMDNTNKCFVVQAPNGKYFNYYSEESLKHGYGAAGPFVNEQEAVSMLQKHRPSAREVGGSIEGDLPNKASLLFQIHQAASRGADQRNDEPKILLRDHDGAVR